MLLGDNLKLPVSVSFPCRAGSAPMGPLTLKHKLLAVPVLAKGLRVEGWGVVSAHRF